jgi:hypothetical protein
MYGSVFSREEQELLSFFLGTELAASASSQGPP